MRKVATIIALVLMFVGCSVKENDVTKCWKFTTETTTYISDDGQIYSLYSQNVTCIYRCGLTDIQAKDTASKMEYVKRWVDGALYFIEKATVKHEEDFTFELP